MKTNLKTPCKECPFLKSALQGWLGPWESPADLHRHVMGEADFACHKTTGGEDEDKPVAEMSRCMGAILYLKKNHKLPVYNGGLKHAMIQYHGVDTEQVMTLPEFIKHHTL